jgi:hypothetical protein
MAKGGKQPGAGRPKGSLTRPRIDVLDYFNEKELKEFWANLKERAKTDSKLAIYFAEQMSGKAPQAIDHTNNGNPFEPTIIQVTRA